MAEKEFLSGTYTILDEIGSGAGGIIYKAYHNRLHKIVVIKKMKEPGRSVIKNRQEVDILKNLNHTYLPQVIDFFENEEGVFTVMSFIPGKSFSQLLKEGAVFSRKELLRWALQLCSALDYLHNQTIPVIHGDIKPANIMLTPEANVCLIDFNISFFLDENTVLGYSDGYTSPEQYMAVSSKRNRGNTKFVIDQKADIYSVGATLYHIATGAKRTNYNNAIDMEALTAAVGPAFAAIIAKATQLDPSKRYQSAYEMVEALNDLPKEDERYKQLIRRQKLTMAGLATGAALFFGLAGFGFLTMQDEKMEKYNQLVDRQIACIENAEFAAADDQFQEAKEMKPSEVESYYQQAWSLYMQGDYEESIQFIENEILANGAVKKEGKRMVDVYALEGLNYIELGDGAAAVEQYVKAVEYGAFEGEDYRDYAIALAYDNQFEKAEEMLDKAEEFGIADASLAYTRGEIHYAKGEFDEALPEFIACIQTAEDTYLCMRAYHMANKIYRNQGNLQASRNLLTEAISHLPMQEQLVLLEALVQTDIDLAENTGDGSYRREAISYLNKIISNGWAGYSDYDTLAILQQKQNDLSAVVNTLTTMQDLYGDDYNIYKRYAFMEINSQEQKNQENRNYSNFKHYYDKACLLYDAEVKGNSSDTEMILLDDAYQQLVSGGWL